MKTLTFILFLLVNLEAFELEFSKPKMKIEKVQEYSSKVSQVKFVSISPKQKAPIIKYDYSKNKVFSDIKLSKDARYDPLEESKKLTNTKRGKNRKIISNIHIDGHLDHVIYTSAPKSLSQKKFIQSLASFNQ